MPKASRPTSIARGGAIGDMSFEEMVAVSTSASASVPVRNAKKRAREQVVPKKSAPSSTTTESARGGVDAVAGHRADIAALKERDPKFYKYLQSNSADLLGFGGDDASSGSDDAGSEEEEDEVIGDDDGNGDADDDDDNDVEEDEEDDELDGELDGEDSDADGNSGGDANGVEENEANGEDDDDDGAADTGGKSGVDVNAADDSGADILRMSDVRAMLVSAFDRGTTRGLGVCVQALRSAVFADGSADFEGNDADATAAARRKVKAAKRSGAVVARNREGKGVVLAESVAAATAPRALRYRIPDARVHMAVITGVLSRAAGALSTLLGKRKNAKAGGAAAEPLAPAPRVALTDYEGWARVRPIARGLLACVIELLTSTRDPRLLVFTLRSTRGLIPYIVAFAPIQRRMLRALVSLWADPPGGNDGVRLVSYLRLRQIATTLPHPTIDSVLRAAYLGFVRSSRNMSEETAVRGGVMFLCVCVCVYEREGKQ